MFEPGSSHRGERAAVRVALLLLLVFAAGIVTGIFALRMARGGPANPASGAMSRPRDLSPGTKSILGRIGAPVEIRFYSVLNSANAAALQPFADRVDRLLAAFAREANGGIRVTRVTASPNAGSAASADGMKAFGLEAGDASFLGLVAAQGGRKESIPLLSPEWEEAIEFDLSRAIGRLISGEGPPISASAAQARAAEADSLKRALPNADALSLENGKRMLREKALNDFKAVSKETERQVRVAQRRLDEAQRSQSESEQQIAMKQLQDLQAEQTEKLKAIAIELQSQIQALERLKAAPAR